MPVPPLTDLHTHAFPDPLATRAIAALTASGGVAPTHDGTIAGLLASMDSAGIDRSVVCSIATRPSQFAAILAWSQQIASERIVPFASIHPDDPELEAHVAEVAAAGVRGLKLHPYYQDCALDDDRVLALCAAATAGGLLVVSHCGYDLAFPHDDRAAPVRVRRLAESLPPDTFIATHTGGWEAWDQVERELLGRPINLEISMTLGWIEPARMRRLLLAHPREHVLFGSDAPWSSQAETLRQVRELRLPDEREAALLRGNAARLLPWRELSPSGLGRGAD